MMIGRITWMAMTDRLNTRALMAAGFMLLILALPHPAPAGDRADTLDPAKLRRYLRGGVSALEKTGETNWLRVQAPQLTAEQAQRLNRLNSLGYMGGSSILGADRPMIDVPLTRDRVTRVVILLDPKTEGYDLRVVLMDEEDELLFRREIPAAEMAQEAKSNSGRLTLEVNGVQGAEGLRLGLDFVSGAGRLAGVEIH